MTASASPFLYKACFLFLLVSLLFCLPAGAQEKSERAAAAEAIFDQARHLVENGQHVEACPKFEESYRLDPGLGTLLYLSDCYENTGRTASAWAGFRQAAAEARASGQVERERIARERAGALQDRLSMLTIAVPDASRLPSLRVTRDGVHVGAVLWNNPIPVDPGRHEIVAQADGKIRWSTDVEVKSRVPVTTVSIPALQDAPERKQPSVVRTAAPRAPPDSASRGESQRRWAYVVGGVGLAGVAVGSVYGLQASSRWDEAKKHCTPELVCDDTGVGLHDDAERAGNIASVAFGLGATALITGAVLWLSAPTDTAEGVSDVGLLLAPASGSPLVGVQAKGRF